MKKEWILIAALIIAIPFIGCTTLNSNAQTEDFSDPSDAVYLSDAFGIQDLHGEIDAATIDAAIQKITGEDFVDETNFSIFASLIDATALSELAATYSEEKALARVQAAGIVNIDIETARYAACALDAHLLSAAAAKELLTTRSIDGDMAAYLLMNIAQANGSARNYLGKISDSNILQKISNVFNTFSLYSDNNLDKFGAHAVQQRASTGYNLKIESENAHFLASHTLTYGHSDETHLKQLVILLNSEGIDARIQIEPKVSIYEYLLEWGPVPEPSRFYKVLQFNDDLYLAYAVEYDAKFEFISLEDLKSFDGIIETYAKKYDANQKEGSTVKLIKGAWWQPLYSASFNPDETAYEEIIDCVLTDNGYSIHPFSLPETKDNLVQTLESISGLDVEESSLFVNKAFYRYLTGEDYQ